MKKLLVIFGFFLFVASISYSQSRLIRPDWVGSPIPESKEDILFKGVGTDRESAIDNAVDMISRSFCNVKSSSRAEVSKESINGVSIPKRYAWKATNLNCGSVDYFNFQVVDEFEDNGRYFVLTKVFAPSLKKAFFLSFIPSAGQFYKSNNVIGGLVVGGMSALGVSSIWAFNSVQDLNSKIEDSRNSDEITKLKSKRNNRITFGYVLLSSAAVTYALSIVHARFHKNPERLYASAFERLDFAPFIAKRSVGISISYHLN